jgi:gliding motility-associated-like protein
MKNGIIILVFICVFINTLPAQSIDWAVKFTTSLNLSNIHKTVPSAISTSGCAYFYLDDSTDINGQNYKGLCCLSPNSKVVFCNNSPIESERNIDVLSLFYNNSSKNIYLLIRCMDSIITGNLKYYPTNAYTYHYLLIAADEKCNWKEIIPIADENSKDIQLNSVCTDDKNEFYLIIKLYDNLKIANYELTGNKKDTQVYCVKLDSAYNYKWSKHIGDGNSVVSCLDGQFNLWVAISGENTNIYKITATGIVTKTNLFASGGFAAISLTNSSNHILLCGHLNGDTGSYVSILKEKIKTYKNYVRVIMICLNKASNQITWVGKTDSTMNNLISLKPVSNNKEEFYFCISGIYANVKVNNQSWYGYIKGSAQSIFKIDTSGRLHYTIPYLKGNLNPIYFPNQSFYLDSCQNVYLFTLVHRCLAKTCADSIYLSDSAYALTSKTSDYLFIKIKERFLNYQVNFECDSIYFENKSINYASYRWETDTTVSYRKNATSGRINKKTFNLKLVGYTVNGCADSISAVINVPSQYIIKAEFETNTQYGCQWVALKFKNTSTTDTAAKNFLTYFWDFGDGITDTSKDPVHIYTHSGNFNVRLVFSNGFCLDTFQLPLGIKILPAARPGFSISQNRGCSPLEVNIADMSSGKIDSFSYLIDDSLSINARNFNMIFVSPGKHKILQVLKGPTGCITQDSVLIEVTPSITQSEPPKIRLASITEENNVDIEWDTVPGAFKYNLYRSRDNGQYEQLATIVGTTYVDKAGGRQSYYYKLEAEDSCGHKEMGPHCRTIYLKAENHTNISRNLIWNPYEGMPGGTKEYQIEKGINDTNFKVLAHSSDLSYLDEENPDAEIADSLFYRIAGLGAGGLVSYSNIVKLTSLPVVWIPNSFSPNNDGINDSFKIITHGLKNYSIKIYNRWGERVFTTKERRNYWDGNNNGTKCPEGIYIFEITYEDNSGRISSRHGNLTLAR